MLIAIEIISSAPTRYVNLKPLVIIFDGLKIDEAAGARVLSISPTGIQTQLLF